MNSPPSSSLSPSLISSLRSQSISLNLQNLQRFDPHIHSILHTLSHTVLYEFNFVTTQWDKMECEGPFFIIQRNIKPYFQLFILNRKSLNNYCQSIELNIEYEIQDNYLFYSIQSNNNHNNNNNHNSNNKSNNDNNKVIGLWFYEKSEVSNTLNIINQLLSKLSDIQLNHNGILDIQQWEFQSPIINSSLSSSSSSNQLINEENKSNNNQNKSSTVNNSGGNWASKAGSNTSNNPTNQGKENKKTGKSTINKDNNKTPIKSTNDSTSSRPQLAVSTSKPLHTKAPPPPVEFEPAIDTQDSSALEARLNSFMSQFESVDSQYESAHREALNKQRKPNEAKPASTTAIAAAKPAAAAPLQNNPIVPAQSQSTISSNTAIVPPSMSMPALIPPSAFSNVPTTSHQPIHSQPMPYNNPIPPTNYSSGPLPPSAFGHPSHSYPQAAPSYPINQPPFGFPPQQPPQPVAFPYPSSIPPPSASQSKAAAIRAQLKAASKGESATAPAAAAAVVQPAPSTSASSLPQSNVNSSSSDELHPLLSQMFASAASVSTNSTPQPQPQSQFSDHSSMAPSVSQLFQSAASQPMLSQAQPLSSPSSSAIPRPPPGMSKEQFRHYLLSLLNDPNYVESSYWRYQNGQQIQF